MNNPTTNFEVNSVYQMRFIGDSDLRPEWICSKLTKTTATFERIGSVESITRKIRTYEGADYIVEGNYSMAPSIQADKKVR